MRPVGETRHRQGRAVSHRQSPSSEYRCRLGRGGWTSGSRKLRKSSARAIVLDETRTASTLGEGAGCRSW